MQDDELVCRCEEVTRAGVRDAIRDGRRSLSGIKRQTRAGMGACQGRTCARLVMRILQEEVGADPGSLVPDTPRTPLVPLCFGNAGGKETEGSGDAG